MYVCLSVHHVPVWCPGSLEEVDSVNTGGCEPPGECRELEPGPLGQQSVLVPTEPSL